MAGGAHLNAVHPYSALHDAHLGAGGALPRAGVAPPHDPAHPQQQLATHAGSDLPLWHFAEHPPPTSMHPTHWPDFYAQFPPAPRTMHLPFAAGVNLAAPSRTPYGAYHGPPALPAHEPPRGAPLLAEPWGEMPLADRGLAHHPFHMHAAAAAAASAHEMFLPRDPGGARPRAGASHAFAPAGAGPAPPVLRQLSAPSAFAGMDASPFGLPHVQLPMWAADAALAPEAMSERQGKGRKKCPVCQRGAWTWLTRPRSTADQRVANAQSSTLPRASARTASSCSRSVLPLHRSRGSLPAGRAPLRPLHRDSSARAASCAGTAMPRCVQLMPSHSASLISCRRCVFAAAQVCGEDLPSLRCFAAPREAPTQRGKSRRHCRHRRARAPSHRRSPPHRRPPPLPALLPHPSTPLLAPPPTPALHPPRAADGRPPAAPPPQWRPQHLPVRPPPQHLMPAPWQ